MAAAAARAAPGGEEEEEEEEEEDGVGDDVGIVGDDDATEGSPPAPWLSSDDAETRTGRAEFSKDLVAIKIERVRGLNNAENEGKEDDFAARRRRERRDRCCGLARCPRGCAVAAALEVCPKPQHRDGEDVDATRAEKEEEHRGSNRRRCSIFFPAGGGEGRKRRRREREKEKRVEIFLSPMTTFTLGCSPFSLLLKKEKRTRRMNGDSGAAAAPATAPLDRDEASARPPGEGVKLDEPAALGEKQQGATMATAAAATEQAPAATTHAPEASAAPAPPARNGGGPFSSTVFPRTVDAIAEDHFKRRDAILRAITDGEKMKKEEDA